MENVLWHSSVMHFQNNFLGRKVVVLRAVILLASLVFPL